jgi:hypothetical protein
MAGTSGKELQMDSKFCGACGQQKPVTEFNFKHKQKGTRQAHCRDCTREQIRKPYQANRGYYIEKAKHRTAWIIAEQRQWIQGFLLTHPCVDCGEGDPRCLDFDHVRGKKRQNVSQMVGDFTLKAIQEEVSKCEVRCASCHRKRTAKQRERRRALSRG